MERKSKISSTERRALLAITSLVFFYFASIIAMGAIQEYNFGVYDAQLTLKNRANEVPDLRFSGHRQRLPALLHLFTFFIMLTLIRPKLYRLPIFLTIIYAFLLMTSFYFRVNGESPLGGDYRPEVGYLGELCLKTWIWDYVGALYVLIALPWLFAIHRRIRNQRISKRVLP